MRSRVPGASADRYRLREAPQRLGPADGRGRIPAWTRSGLSSQPPRPSLSPTGSGQTIRRSSPASRSPALDAPTTLADPYLSAQRQSPRPCRLPGSLPRRAPRPARLPRAEITELRPAAPRLQGCARSSASCRARRAVIGGTTRPPSGVAQSEPRTLARLPKGRGRGWWWLQSGTSPCGGTSLVTPPSPGSRVPGVARNPSRTRPAPLSGAWRVRVLPYPLSPSHLGLAGASAHPPPSGAGMRRSVY